MSKERGWFQPESSLWLRSVEVKKHLTEFPLLAWTKPIMYAKWAPEPVVIKWSYNMRVKRPSESHWFSAIYRDPKTPFIAGVHLVDNVWGAIFIVSRGKSDRHRGIAQLCISNTTRCLFHFFNFHPDAWGNDAIWRAYFSIGLKPPTRLILTLLLPTKGCGGA